MVEWKTLGEVCEIKTGKGITQKDCSEDALYPVISGGQLPMGMYKEYNREGNNVTISRVGAYAGFVSFIKERFYLNDKCFSIIPFNNIFLPVFLYHYLKSKEDIIKLLQSEGGVPTINTKKLSDIQIPIPSKPEQERIVKILDTFTDSIANLKAQIDARRKQYEYYRDQLLDLEGKEGVEMKTIKEIFDTRNGYTPSTKNDEFWNSGTIPWFKMEDIRENGRILSDSTLHITPKGVKGKGLFKANSIILSTSATIGEHALILVEHLSNQRFTNFYPKKEFEDKVNMKFYYYYMFIIDEWCKQHINQGGFASVDMEGLYKLEIPLPSLKEQSRIVGILDQFEAIIANLEAQLKAREKQYEYYRNKLLTFD